VVEGLIATMGGRVSARPSDLGGLAIEVDLPRAPGSAALGRPSGADPVAIIGIP
jgi:hypothetical protein